MATPPAEVSVRLAPLEPRDEAALRQLLEANDVPSVTRWFDPFPLDAATASTIAHHAGADLYWGVWEGPALAGLTMVRGWDAGRPHRAYGCLIDRPRQGRGLGRAATRASLDDLRRRGTDDTVRARVHDDNLRSLAMLRSCGFAEIARGGGRVVLECRLRPG